MTVRTVTSKELARQRRMDWFVRQIDNNPRLAGYLFTPFLTSKRSHLVHSLFFGKGSKLSQKSALKIISKMKPAQRLEILIIAKGYSQLLRKFVSPRDHLYPLVRDIKKNMLKHPRKRTLIGRTPKDYEFTAENLKPKDVVEFIKFDRWIEIDEFLKEANTAQIGFELEYGALGENLITYVVQDKAVLSHIDKIKAALESFDINTRARIVSYYLHSKRFDFKAALECDDEMVNEMAKALHLGHPSDKTVTDLIKTSVPVDAIFRLVKHLKKRPPIFVG